MSTDLTTQAPHSPIPSDAEAESLYKLATTLAASGLFKDTQQAGQAFAKILVGRDLGLGATQALIGIDLIEGKPSLSANLQAALLRQYRSPEGARYDYRADTSAAGCRILVLRREPGEEWQEIGSTFFGLEDAKAAGLAGGKNYAKYAQNMYFARAISNAVAFHCPEVTYGTRTYSEGEMTGELVNPSPIPPTTLPKPEPVDDRDAVNALRDAARTFGIGAEQIGALLDSANVPHVEPLRKRIAMTDDDVLLIIVDQIETAADAEVVG